MLQESGDMASELDEKLAGRSQGTMGEKDNASGGIGEKHGIFQADVHPYNAGNEKGVSIQHAEHNISKDGVRLHPQPTADPFDPLNWSSFSKHIILAIVMYL